MSGSRVYRQGEGEWGDHVNSLPFVGRVLEQVQFYREMEKRGGGCVRQTETGETKIVKKEIQSHQRGTKDHQGGAVS